MARAKIGLALGTIALALGSRAGGQTVDFAAQIRPIFAQSCYKCHGGEAHKGGLKLDSAAAILKGGKDDPAVTPGDLKNSDLYARITAAPDADERMPPKGPMLSKTQTDLVKAWIEQGAKFGNWKAEAPGAPGAPSGDSAATAIKEPPLPTVAPADAASMDEIRQSGGMAMKLAQDTNLVDVEFQLGGSKIGDAQLAALSHLSEQVFWLNLANTKVTDSGLAALEPLKNLEKLHLEKTAITDVGLTHLRGLTHLTYLNLYGDQITDAGLEALYGLKSLKELYLWQTKVTPAGVEALKKEIPGLMVNVGWVEPPAPPAPAPPPAMAPKPPATAPPPSAAPPKAPAP
jgi:mono/diheme cytochrome c family protein